MRKRQRTEDRRQMVVCRCAARFKRLRGKAATKSQSPVLSPQSSERGFSLITAIFLLVVIAALGTFAVTLSTTQQQSAALDVLASRAYQAARAGVEWGAFQITQSGVAANGFAADCQSNSALHATAAQPVLPAGTQLSEFSVGIACGATSHVEGDTPLWIYRLTSTASGVAGAAPGSPNYVERQVSVTIAQ